MRTLAAASGAFLALTLLATPAGAQGRYEVAGGCFSLRSESSGALVSKGADGYTATGVGEAERFRLQATDLGKYLLYGDGRDFLAVDPQNRIRPAARASESAVWEAHLVDGEFVLFSPAARKALAVLPDGAIGLASARPTGDDDRFTLAQAADCADYPEAEVNAVGEPFKGSPRYGEVRGFVDPHVHLMTFEFLGGNALYGQTWHPFGAAHALEDCAEIHGPNGTQDYVGNVRGTPQGHETRGWPTFREWPHHDAQTHNQTYYKWVERAWRGGLRLMVHLATDNEVLCQIYPTKRNDCNEMASARLQRRRTFELQDYIDAQSGGPGRGWFRVVDDPFEARDVINGGKLAVVLGIEISKLFDCDIYNDVPECDRQQIDQRVEEVADLGFRSFMPIHKYDNAFGGVKFDSGTTGAVVNGGNRIQTGRYWSIETCTGPEADNEQLAPGDVGLANGLSAFLPPGTAPVYPPPPHCNTKGLSPLGEYVVRRMIDKGLIIDPDHMSALARNNTLAILDSERYSGVVSSHSWSTPQSYARILQLGGVVTPISDDSESFVEDWRYLRSVRSGRYYYGMGFGSDATGLHSLGGPREGNDSNPVRYPFQSFDGAVTLDRQRTGERVFDINTDGTAHYGLFPDWIEDLRMVAGDQIVKDMSRGAEAYLQMWERAVGVPRTRCLTPKAGFETTGLRRLRLGVGFRRALSRAGQPLRRKRAWTYCVKGEKNRRARVVSVFTRRGRIGLVASNARLHKGLGVGRGARASRLRGTTRVGRMLRVRRFGRRGARLVYGVRGGRVRFVAVAARPVARRPRRLRGFVRLARMR